MRAVIVGGKHQINVLKTVERRFHFHPCHRLQPLHVRLENHMDIGARNRLAKAQVPLLAGSGGHQTHQFNHVAFAVKRLHDPFACRITDLFIVAADKTGIIGSQYSPIQHDDRDAGRHRSGDRRGERLGFFGTDDDQVYILPHKFLDFVNLSEGVVLSIFENDL